MRKTVSTLLLASALLLTSCGSKFQRQVALDETLKQKVPTKEEQAQDLQHEFSIAVTERLQAIREQIGKGKLDAAQEMLKPLLVLEESKAEAEVIQKRIDAMRAIITEQDKIALSKKEIMAETENKMVLPGTYGQTVTVDADMSPITLPPGPMEQLAMKKVSITHSSLGVQELIALLVQEGLNAVADEGLLSGNPDEAAKKISISVKDVPLLELFGYLSRNMGIAFHIGENLVWITKTDTTASPKLETRIFKLPYGFIPTPASGSGLVSDAGDDQGDALGIGAGTDLELQEALEMALNGEGADGGDETGEDADSAPATFKIFPTRNLVIVRGTREKIRLAERVIEDFTRPPVQVAIEAKFITVTESDLKDLGVEFKRINGGTPGEGYVDLDVKARANVSNFLTELGAIQSGNDNGVGSLTLSGVIGHRSYDMLISALEKKDSTITLSSPRITVLNNRPANIRKGDKIYYFEEYDIETIDRGDSGNDQALVPTGSPTELPLGITFNVKASVGRDLKSIMLSLKPEIIEFLGWESYTTGGDSDSSSSDNSSGLSQIKLPKTHEQIVSTAVNINSGETVVLGGMTENNRNKTIKKLPILGDLPLIGVLFRHTVEETSPKNLLIFVTATILNDKGEFVRVND